tara:strand:- start:9078 stop:10289 length:1212 start_codon:yes stop_codon:yes gene_type:complete
MFAITADFAPAFAQTDSRTTTVGGRERPELDALGVKRGGFTVFPSVEVSETYEDNIFNDQTGTIDDFITTVTPAVRVLSNWSTHSLRFNGSGDIVRYATNDKEDNEKYKLSTDGRLDIQRDTSVSGLIGYEKSVEDRGSVDDANGLTPTEYDVISLDAGFRNKWNRVSLDSRGTLRRRDFDDVATTAGVTNNDDRDRDEYKLDVRGEYEILPEYNAFAQVILTSIDYDSAVDDAGVNRDNEGYEIRGGARIDISGLLFGDVFVGYISRDYEAASLNSVDEFSAGVDLTWNATALTTVKGGVKRGVSETTLVSSSGNLSTAVNASVDHELLRNLILTGRLGVSRDEFKGTNREDEYIRAGVRAKYMLNRYVYLTLDYDYATRESNAANSDYDTNKVLFKIRGQL